MATEQIDTIIGAQVELTGSLKNDGPIQIHGHVNGDVLSNSIVFVGETAIVKGPITAKSVEVAGQVHGDITAEDHIELHPKSLVKGNLNTRQLSIKPGAMFIGSSKMHTGNEEAIISEESAAKRSKPRLEIE